MKKREREDVRERRGRHIGGDREDGGDRERRERERERRSEMVRCLQILQGPH
mgnify:CR=1 FL=1